eukprot:TRINITY_DN22592_c0_g1_i1.p1 TRINITY_DN22592_c0_g1~~TRINITY_DN22592_c0_g1_i1.p1  ORF type:complete len:790 (+),score=300.42 TRINITY_DN22592_c0_g1_i1:72-2372(+)
MEEFKKIEEEHGVRWTWHLYPNKTNGKDRNMVGGFFQPECVIPLACVITPMKTSHTPVIQGDPMKCKQCGAVANAYCNPNFQNESWTCSFCRSRNALRARSYEELTPEFHQGMTVEYVLPRQPLPPPAFIFVLDLALSGNSAAAELEGQKRQLAKTISMTPEGSLIGLITVGRFVSVYELGSDSARCVVLTGVPKTGEYPLEKVRQFLGVSKAARGGQDQGVVGRYLVQKSDAMLRLPDVLEGLSTDPWPANQKHRLLRATGPAVEVATGVAELLNQGQVKFHGRILLFTSGPACKGQGKIVSDHLDETIRQYADIDEGNTPHLKKSTEFGMKIAKRLKGLNFALDMFMIALDQVGLLELTEAVSYTGGNIVSTDSSETDVFTGSLDKMFEQAKNRDTHNMFFEAVLEVQTSSETKIAGCIGPCRSLEKMSSSVSTTVEVGEAKTCAWKTSVIDQSTSFTVVFDAESGSAEKRYAQFITSFIDTHGQRRLRVTTCCQQIAQAPTREVMNSCWAFDQLTAAAVLGKMAAKYMEQNNNILGPVLRWLDRSLIKFVKQFSTVAPQPGNPDSLQLLPQYTLLPQFMYHLRRSEFLQVFNCSVDEIVFFRSALFRENVQECVIMLQPTLFEYVYGVAEGNPVLLDSKSLKSDNILFCDAYFDVTIHHGSTIAEWRDQGYDKTPGYEPFAEQLAAPHRDMAAIVARRFPTPKITICDQNGSQARYLLNKLNPSDTQAPNNGQGGDVQVIHTDDANLQTFMKQLKRLATKKEE